MQKQEGKKILIRNLSKSKRKNPTRWEKYKAFRYHLIHLADHKCQRCSKYNERLLIHHKDMKSMQPPEMFPERNIEENCMVVCTKCHAQIHAKGKALKRKNWPR